MASQSTPLNNGRQATQHTDRSKLMFGEIRTEKALYNNSAYDSVNLSAGTVMGRVKATGWIKPVASGASDGSQYPIGILAHDQTVEGGDLVELLIVTEGDVSDSQVVWSGSDNKETTVGDRRLKDWLRVVGINLKSVDELSGYDND